MRITVLIGRQRNDNLASGIVTSRMEPRQQLVQLAEGSHQGSLHEVD
jgi:hypothetical protein